MNFSIYYDGDCPFCTRYVRFLRLREAAGSPRLVDLRQAPEAVARFTDLGIQVDQGMVVELDGRLHAGADAMNVLALMSSPVGVFNHFNRAVFSSARLSALLYPWLRAGRNAALFTLGRKQVTTGTQQWADFFALFGIAWGFFCFLHLVSYAFFFHSEVYPTTVAIGALGVALIYKPASHRVFFLSIPVMCIDAWLQAPMFSNHTMLKNFVLLTMLGAGARQMLRGGNWDDFLRDFVPGLRVLLAVMYVFGVFHKINSDFLNADTSCAVALWVRMPLGLPAIDHPLFLQLTMWGTLVIETLILLCLLLPSLRGVGIWIGIAFHSLLGMSEYAMYPQFSLLTVCLHLAYLDGRAVQRLALSPVWIGAERFAISRRGRTAIAGWLVLIAVIARTGAYSSVGIAFLLPVLLLLLLLAHLPRRVEAGRERLLWSRSLAVNLISLLFFFNCITPYLGLKTSQSMNMFANLRLEGGISNHRLLPNAPGPFHYLEDLIEIEAVRGSQYLAYVQREDLRMVYYDFLDQLDREPHAVVSYIRNGVLHENQTASMLATERERVLHPAWMRKWFHFNPVDLREPKPCALDR